MITSVETTEGVWRTWFRPLRWGSWIAYHAPDSEVEVDKSSITVSGEGGIVAKPVKSLLTNDMGDVHYAACLSDSESEMSEVVHLDDGVYHVERDSNEEIASIHKDNGDTDSWDPVG